jgi:hypothetical protein
LLDRRPVEEAAGSLAMTDLRGKTIVTADADLQVDLFLDG